jgi:sucrose-6-phosphate hydrolase SacC (GH32 family)
MNKISDLKVGDKVALKNGSVDIFLNRRTGCGAARLENHHHIHDEKIDWEKTTELNNKQMKEFIIECPSGYEIDKEKSTFEKIVFKEIGVKFPESVAEIKGINRRWYIGDKGEIFQKSIDSKESNQLSSPDRAKAFLALMQLVELREYVNGDWKADWIESSAKYTIGFYKNHLIKSTFIGERKVLNFKSEEIRDQFAEKYKDLIETAKELL